MKIITGPFVYLELFSNDFRCYSLDIFFYIYKFHLIEYLYEEGSIIIITSEHKSFVLRCLMWNMEYLCFLCLHAQSHNRSYYVSVPLIGEVNGGVR